MRGFAGLDQFATDVDTAIAEADRIASGPPPVPERPDRGASQPDSSQSFGDTALGRFAKSAGGWVVGIGILLVLKFAIWGGVHTIADEDSSDSYDSATYEAPADYSASADEADTVEMPADETFASTDTPADDYTDSDDGYSAPTIGEGADNSTSRPSPGTVELTRGELRYCMEEMERLKGEKSEMESLQYSDVDRFNDNVDAFNSRIGDLRSSCNGNYRTSDETAVNAELSLRRYSLEQEGRNRVR